MMHREDIRQNTDGAVKKIYILNNALFRMILNPFKIINLLYLAFILRGIKNINILRI